MKFDIKRRMEVVDRTVDRLMNPQLVPTSCNCTVPSIPVSSTTTRHFILPSRSAATRPVHTTPRFSTVSWDNQQARFQTMQLQPRPSHRSRIGAAQGITRDSRRAISWVSLPSTCGVIESSAGCLHL
jgi:hypothetical protein